VQLNFDGLRGSKSGIALGVDDFDPQKKRFSAKQGTSMCGECLKLHNEQSKDKSKNSLLQCIHKKPNFDEIFNQGKSGLIKEPSVVINSTAGHSKHA